MMYSRYMWALVILIAAIFIPVSHVNAQGVSRSISEIDVSPDGVFTAVSYSYGRTILMNNNAQSEAILRPDGGDGASGIMIFAWSHDGTMLAGGDTGGDVFIWDLDTYQLITTLGEGYGVVTGLDWTPDDSELLIGYSMTGAVVRNIESGAIRLEILVGQTFGASFSPDGAKILMAPWTGIGMWDAANGENLLLVETGASEYPTWNTTGDKFTTVSTDDSTILLVIRDGTTGSVIRTLDTPAGVEIGGFSEAGWSPDDQFIYAGTFFGRVNVWNAQTGVFVESIHYDGRIFALDITPDGSQFVFGGTPNSGDATVQYADAPTATTDTD